MTFNTQQRTTKSQRRDATVMRRKVLIGICVGACCASFGVAALFLVFWASPTQHHTSPQHVYKGI